MSNIIGTLNGDGQVVGQLNTNERITARLNDAYPNGDFLKYGDNPEE